MLGNVPSFGVILTLIGLIYGISKFINGILADRTNARWHLVIGLGACAIINLIFGWSDRLSHWISGQESGPDFVNAVVVIITDIIMQMKCSYLLV